MLFRRLHLQLTGLCALITIAILSVFTVLYLSVAEHTMKENLKLSFKNHYDTLSSSLKQQSVLTYQYLLRMEQNNDSLIFLWDNGSPLSFNDLEHHAAYRRLSDALYENYCAQAASGAPEEAVLYSSSVDPIQENILSTFRSDDVYMGVSNISTDGMSASEKASALKKNQGLVLLVLSPNTALHSGLIKQRISFALLSLSGCALLTLFSYVFTGKMLKPLRENHEKQLAFIAGASHELRTPLAVILSAADARPPLFEETIKGEALRMGRLVDELLTLSRLDRQGEPSSRSARTSHPQSLFKFAPLEPDTFLLSFYEQTESYVLCRNRSFSLSLPDEPLPELYADQEKLRQLMEILLENALSYTKEGGHICLAVRRALQTPLPEARAARRKKSSDWLYLEVSDDGIGIPDGEKEKVFERFYRVESAHSSKEHFGLGLCIAKEIVQAHKGHILVLDTPGGGCTFRCILPAASRR